MTKTLGSTNDEDSRSDGNQSSDGGESLATSAHGSKFGASKEGQEAIAQDEEKAVFRIRVIMLLVLMLTTIGVAYGLYILTLNSQQTEFETSFLDDSTKVLEALGSTTELSFGAIDAFIVSMVSFAANSNMTWPFVTVPNYGARAAKVRSLSKAVVISQYHIVSEDQRTKWEKYSLKNRGWVDEVLEIQKGDTTFEGSKLDEYSPSMIYGNSGPIPYGTGPYYPSWQGYPSVPIYPPFNWDGSTYPSLVEAFNTLKYDREVVIGTVGNLPTSDDPAELASVEALNFWVSDFVGPDFPYTQPTSDLHYPIFKTAADQVFTPAGDAEGSDEDDMVGVLSMTFYWHDLISNILPERSTGTVVVIENTCKQAFTYQIDGPSVKYLGVGDLHDPTFDYLEQGSTLAALKDYFTDKRRYTGLGLSEKSCPYSVRVYASEDYMARYINNDPLIYMGVAICIFVFTSLVFLLYDYLVERRQRTVMKKAVQSSAIVASLFPSNVRSRLYEENTEKNAQPQKSRLKSFLSDADGHGNLSNSVTTPGISGSPIADLFPETTVMFADISGFTAWSSAREPAHVFVLLETLYGAFDRIASRRGVFKVETIGDSYVAVAGLPEPRKDHAIVMVKFAADCRSRMLEVTRDLGTSLGPDTEDLAMRFGLHSGPVTAGVLRGQKSRFQLFGDTVNTASRMESTGQNGRIQISQSTADELVSLNRANWVIPRDDVVEAKGKGVMRTFWAEPREGAGSVATSVTVGFDGDLHDSGRKANRLVEWNVDVLSKLLRAIILRRRTSKSTLQKDQKKFKLDIPAGRQVLHEVKEIIELPDFDPSAQDEDPYSMELNPAVEAQLLEYVRAIAVTYHSNPFHNFEHASHVGMSVAKLLSRIVAADSVYDKPLEKGSIQSTKHDHTFGITSDPLTQFACVFAALIHDVDHQGVPNTQLVKEATELAKFYNNRSVAEQNSVDIAWNLFMDQKFDRLREAICETNEEMRRFRQLVVNCVMATDIMDKELKALRNARWDKAFSKSEMQEESPRATVNRKATIVIEHLLQASDVAHTMQHWHIYRKWNERLFEEMHRAYMAGRAEKNPAEFWYEGEIGFFDFYIVPLAKKLSECGVFGVSSDEYLNYALKNREEWKEKGEEIVANMVKQLEKSSNDE